MKNYLSIIYFSSGINNRINVGLIMFNDEKCIVDIKDSRLSFVKLFKPAAFHLFKDSILSFRSYYRRYKPTFDEIKTMSIYQNGILRLDEPKVVKIELSKEKFYKYFELI